MAYIRNIPQPTDIISNSQGQLLGNFQAIDSGTTQTGIGFSRNHVTMTDATNGGLHNRIDFFQNISTPSISGFVSSLYPKNISSQSELSYKNGSGEVQVTSGALPIWKGGTIGTSGVSTVSSTNLTLPNGLQFSYGTGTTASNGKLAVTFNFPTNLYSATITPVVQGSTIIAGNWLTTPTKTGGTIQTTALNGTVGAATVFWIAIGN